MPGFSVHHQFPELAMSIESVMPSNHLILCRPLLLLPSIFPRFRVFSNESILCIRWSRYWSFSLSISPSNEHSGQISFRMDSPCNHFHHFNDTDHLSLCIMSNNLKTCSHALSVLIPTTVLWVGGDKSCPHLQIKKFGFVAAHSDEFLISNRPWIHIFVSKIVSFHTISYCFLNFLDNTLTL